MKNDRHDFAKKGSGYGIHMRKNLDEREAFALFCVPQAAM
eukprot:COSAG05_NODE_14575_length_393_cov_0.585034_2_plen_39_part_01